MGEPAEVVLVRMENLRREKLGECDLLGPAPQVASSCSTTLQDCYALNDHGNEDLRCGKRHGDEAEMCYSAAIKTIDNLEDNDAGDAAILALDVALLCNPSLVLLRVGSLKPPSLTRGGRF